VQTNQPLTATRDERDDHLPTASPSGVVTDDADRPR
jgi:hypothetical protein